MLWFFSSHVWMWELGNKKCWVPKNWCLWTVVLEKTLESLLDSKEIKPVNPKGNQPWFFLGRTVLKLKLQYFGHLMQTVDSLEKTLMPRKTEGRRRRAWQDGGWVVSLTQWTWVWASSGKWWKMGEDWHAPVHGVTKSQTRLRDWTVTTKQTSM